MQNWQFNLRLVIKNTLKYPSSPGEYEHTHGMEYKIQYLFYAGGNLAEWWCPKKAL